MFAKSGFVNLHGASCNKHASGSTAHRFRPVDYQVHNDLLKLTTISFNAGTSVVWPDIWTNSILGRDATACSANSLPFIPPSIAKSLSIRSIPERTGSAQYQPVAAFVRISDALGLIHRLSNQ